MRKFIGPLSVLCIIVALWGCATSPEGAAREDALMQKVDAIAQKVNTVVVAAAPALGPWGEVLKLISAAVIGVTGSMATMAGVNRTRVDKAFDEGVSRGAKGEVKPLATTLVPA